LTFAGIAKNTVVVTARGIKITSGVWIRIILNAANCGSGNMKDRQTRLKWKPPASRLKEARHEYYQT
jgi:hypothetical protein